jgi:hypothetical protein
MSTAPGNQPIPVARALAPKSDDAPSSIRIVSHCTLFYWWPVWAIGFIMAAITYLQSPGMVVVGRGAEFFEEAEVRAGGQTFEKRAAVVFAAGKNASAVREEPLRISTNRSLGVLYSIVLLLVIAITNVPLRGMWSVIVLVLIISLSIIFALLDWWEPILAALRVLDIRLNFEGYLVISSVLLFLWLLVFFFFDNQIYMTFTPGQLRVRQEIGDAETAYDTTGMTIHKQRSDLFRHWILGLGSGDLIVNTTGAQSHHFEMPNVLFLGRKVNEIEKMLSSRQVVATKEA